MLNKLALRLATVRALRGNTNVADENILDSEYGAIDELADEHPRPFIVVYTDDSQYTVTGRDLLATVGSDRVDSGTLKLVIEIAITARMKVDEDKDGNPILAAVPLKTDGTMELNIDFIERQVVDAVMKTGEGSEWADIWKTFATDIKNKDVQRGISARDGMRFAGRQITLSVVVPKDPPVGVPIGPLWGNFLALAETDPTLTKVVPALKAMLAGEILPDWQITQGAYGLSTASARALQIAPGVGNELAPPISKIYSDFELTGIGSDIDPEDMS